MDQEKETQKKGNKDLLLYSVPASCIQCVHVSHVRTKQRFVMDVSRSLSRVCVYEITSRYYIEQYSK